VLQIEKASVNDAQEILSLQKLAYLSEAKIYNDYKIQPLLETLDQTKNAFETQTVLKAIIDGSIVGSIRFSVKDCSCFVGKLIVDPALQNQGIGVQLLLEIERYCPSVTRFELFTGDKSAKNLYLYEKLGYKPFKTETVNENLNLVFLEKRK
jgi:GNAT superfamily N-acetyltransferase